eukprot:4854874-Pyramimonas_sp.AAC.1
MLSSSAPARPGPTTGHKSIKSYTKASATDATLSHKFLSQVTEWIRMANESPEKLRLRDASTRLGNARKLQLE